MTKKIAFTCLATAAISSICYAIWTVTLCPVEKAAFYRLIAIQNLVFVLVAGGLILFGELESRKRRKIWKEEQEAWRKEMAEIKKDFCSWKKNG
jgi:hypothetical protein